MISMYRSLPTLCLVALLAGPARGADEVAFWNLWKTHLAGTSKHKEAIAACDAFERNNPGDAFIVVARQFKAWHLLKQGRNEKAIALLTPLMKSGAKGLEKAASDLARGWLTRLDREIVKNALQEVYKHEVAYPEKLNVWKRGATGAPPLADRWGRSWDYRLTGFSRIPGLRNQKYGLRSILLGDVSDLDAALALPYAAQISLRPLSLRHVASGPPLVEFETDTDGGKATLAVGRRHERTLFAYMGDRIILVADYTHWKVLPKPKR